MYSFITLCLTNASFITVGAAGRAPGSGLGATGSGGAGERIERT